MPLNKQSGNMYSFVTHTWNPIKGKCSHDCSYCYMKRFPQNPIRLDEKELKTDLGSGNFIFVGSGTDMWASDVSDDRIRHVLKHCQEYKQNRYLFQSKNPGRFRQWQLPKRLNGLDVILASTIETNREQLIINSAVSMAPWPYIRAQDMTLLRYQGFKTMITIEPVLDFDCDELVTMIRPCAPEWVNIGADSKGHDLPEPPAEKIKELIAELSRFTEVKLKSNLKRLGVEV